jgi:hypothetical protein
MMDPVTREDFGLSGVHEHGDRHHQRASWQAQALVDVAIETQALGDRVQLRDGRSV